jgi:hypothetical protein
MGKREKRAFLEELYGEEGFDYKEETGHAIVNGEVAYITDPTRSLSMRHELIADLASTGMKPSEIARVVKTNPEKSDGGHYSRLLRDPRIRARSREEAQDVLSKAKENLKGAVVKASENIANAVKAGDIKMSKYVLATQGVTDKLPSQPTNVNIGLGDWLSQVQNTKTMHTIESTEAEVICDSSALPGPVEDGETL